MPITLDSVLNIVVPVGIFGFIFYLFYTNIPIFRKFIDATIDFIKEQAGIATAKASQTTSTAYQEIRYG